MVPSIQFDPHYLTLVEEGDLIVVGFTASHLTEEENIEQLGHELFTVVNHFGCRKLILDLSAVEYLTSSVLGKMITLHRRLHRREGRLVLCGLGDEVTGILRRSRLLDYFHVARDFTGARTMVSWQR